MHPFEHALSFNRRRFSAAAIARDKPNLALVNKIRAEAFEPSQAVENAVLPDRCERPARKQLDGFKVEADWAVSAWKAPA